MTSTLAIIFGVYLICAGLGLTLRKSWANEVLTSFEDSPAVTYVTGAVVLMGGCALILTHNIWTGWPEILVTLFGWGAAIEGALFLIYPKAMIKIGQAMIPPEKFMPVMGILIMVFGAAIILT